MLRLPRLVVVLCLLLSGYASVIRSEVTAFHQWPASMPGKRFVFSPSAEQSNSLEYQSYAQLIRKPLHDLGLEEAVTSETAQLKVDFSATISGRDVRVVDTVLVDSFYGTPRYGPGFISPYWGYTGYGYPFYGPGWGGVPVAREQETRYTIFHRELKLKITDAASLHSLYEVTVRSDGKEGNLAKVMPYLVESAFRDFPGKSGVPQVIELKMKE